MDSSLYDEFGNFIGELSDSDSDSDTNSDIDDNNSDEFNEINNTNDINNDNNNNDEYNTNLNNQLYDENEGMAVVLHEDKEYYPSAEDVYGKIKTLVIDEDAMDINEPLIKSNIQNKYTNEKEIYNENNENIKHPDLLFSTKYLIDSIINDKELNRVRNIALIGHLGHGKTSFMDLLIKDVLTSEQEYNDNIVDDNNNDINHIDKYEKKKLKKKKDKKKKNDLIMNNRFNYNEIEDENNIRYTDLRKDEQDRKMSIKSTPCSLLLNTSNSINRTRGAEYYNKDELIGYNGTPYLLNIIDCPGHPNFSDECIAALQITDGFCIVVDVIEGVMMQTKRLIKAAIMNNGHSITPVLILNKMDRLILELRIPPQDAYFKCLYIIEEINQIIATYTREMLELEELKERNIYLKNKKKNKNINNNNNENNNIPETKSFLQRISPDLGNVCFASSRHGWLFTLYSFAEMYKELSYKNNNNKNKKGLYNIPFDINQFAIRLWGNSYYNKNKNTFQKKPISSSSKRAFVEFILEPIYKIYSQVLGEDRLILKNTLKELGLMATKSIPYGIKIDELALDVKPLLNLVMSHFLGSGKKKRGANNNTSTGAFVDMIKEFIPSPKENAPGKISSIWTGNQLSTLSNEMKLCDQDNNILMINVVKMYMSSDGKSFTALGRIFSGTLNIGDNIRVLGENFTLTDNEDESIEKVKRLLLPVGNIKLEVDHITAGNIILIEGITDTISKTATLTNIDHDINILNEIATFKKLQFIDSPIIKVSIEPLIPSELPKMIEGLRSITKTYPIANTKMEDSGEHIIYGTGELFMDSVLHDIREIYSNIEIKVSDPVVSFAETVVEMSAIQCFSDTPNKQNRFTMIAEPLETGLVEDIENHKIDLNWDKKTFGNYLQNNYDWDYMASRSVWAFGPDIDGPNVLIDDTISEDVNKKVLNSVKNHIIQGFNWACREGPLCQEPIRNTKFRLLDATIANEQIYRGGGQILPTSRRVIYSSFLMATPRLMEPIYDVEIQIPSNIVSSVYDIVNRRRGNVYQNRPHPGTPFHIVKAYLPVMDSFGFETDLRSYTHGQGFCLQVFNHWEIVPGDPLDKDIILHPLQPAPIHHLARDFMIKTRRRKGLTDDISVTHFFGEEMIMEMSAVQNDI